MPMALFAKPTRISRVHDSVWIRPGSRSSFGFSSAATRPSLHFLHSRLPHGPSRYGNCDVRARAAEEGDEPMEGSSAEALDVKALVEDTLATEGLGKRGEVLFAGQAVLVALAIFTPHVIEDVASLAGYITLLGGTGLAALALNDLGNSLSPFPKPRDDGVLVTTGVYSYVRHPMYAGLLLFVLGLSLTSSSSAKFFLFLSLLLLIDTKANREEQFLKEKYGEKWDEYAIRVRKILPFLY